MKSFFLEFHGAPRAGLFVLGQAIVLFALGSQFFVQRALPTRRFMAEMIFALDQFRF